MQKQVFYTIMRIIVYEYDIYMRIIVQLKRIYRVKYHKHTIVLPAVGDTDDGLYLDPRGSAATHEIADSATGRLTTVKQSTRQCLAAGSCAA